jgi:phosphomannomutase/phosphoglucomutase
MQKPATALAANSPDFEITPLVKPTGFREYDARWWMGTGKAGEKAPEINLAGITALGLGLGTYIREQGVQQRVVVGHDYREYSERVKHALISGLVSAGCTVLDIGLAVTPMAYFAQYELDAPAVAMVTASHNENGWTGVKMGCQRPLTFGPVEMQALRDIVLQGRGVEAAGGSVQTIAGIKEKYIADLVGDTKLARKLKVVCATGNGTAGAFGPDMLRALGCDVVELHCDLDWNFPNYNANPEDKEMLHDMAHAVRAHGADLCIGLDGDGDRVGVVDDEGEEIFADKIGLMLARDLAPLHKGATFVVDVKSTGLYATDPVLKAHNVTVDYWKTGHSYIKRRTVELNALAGFEKSGHFFFRAPYGRGYDDALVSAKAVLMLMDRNPGQKLSDMRKALPVAFTSLTMAPHCADEVKYEVLERIVAEYKTVTEILGRKVVDVNTVNGVRVSLTDGSWVLVRASSNKPELVVVVESMQSADDMRALFRDEVKPRLARYAEIGGYNQEI